MRKLLTLLTFFIISIALAGCVLTTDTTTNITSSETSGVTMSGLSTVSTSDLSTISTGSITTDTTAGSTIQTTNPTTVTTTEEVTTTEYQRYQEIKLFSINDFHGGAYTSIDTIEKIGAYLKNKKDTTDNSIVLSAGDIFQGTALSNYYHGLPLVDVFNYIGFDGFVLGNHEFDWGIEEVLKYRDGLEENGEFDCPILAANIVYEDTMLPLENTIPYIIEEINGVRVGVIGLIGNVINSIAASRTENIVFTDPSTAVYDYAYELRHDQDCDIVVVYIHEGDYINNTIANFTGDHLVDAVFNGHTHSNTAGSISRNHAVSLFYAQASNYSNSLFTGITLTYDKETEEVISGSSKVYDEYDLYSYSDSNIEQILYNYDNDAEYRAFVDQELADVEGYYSRYDMAPWGASVIRDYLGIDVGAVNRGGFRVNMEPGILTMGELITIYPFDNVIKTCEMSGEMLQEFYEYVQDHNYDVVFDDSLTYSGSNLYIDGTLVQATSTYTVGAVDYIFDKDIYYFLQGDNITYTGYLMRDLLAEDLLNVTGQFNPADGSHLLAYHIPAITRVIERKRLFLA